MATAKYALGRRSCRGLSGGACGLDFVNDCLARARPQTRFFFRTDVEDLGEAAVMAREIKGRCGRTERPCSRMKPNTLKEIL